MCNCTSGNLEIPVRRGACHRAALCADPSASPRNDSGAVAISIAIFGVLADVLDGHHMLVFGGVEYDDALGRAAGDPDALHRTADQLTLVGHQHDLVAVLDRE